MSVLCIVLCVVKIKLWDIWIYLLEPEISEFGTLQFLLLYMYTFSNENNNQFRSIFLLLFPSGYLGDNFILSYFHSR